MTTTSTEGLITSEEFNLVWLPNQSHIAVHIPVIVAHGNKVKMGLTG